jgi:hypothetical protein
MLIMVTKQTPARMRAAATMAIIAETLRSLVFPGGEDDDLVPFVEQVVSKGAPQRKGLLENAGAPKCCMVEISGMTPERLLNERSKFVKLFKSPREGGIGPESELCDRSKYWILDRFPRLDGMIPLSWL